MNLITTLYTLYYYTLYTLLLHFIHSITTEYTLYYYRIYTHFNMLTIILYNQLEIN